MVRHFNVIPEDVAAGGTDALDTQRLLPCLEPQGDGVWGPPLVAPTKEPDRHTLPPELILILAIYVW